MDFQKRECSNLHLKDVQCHLNVHSSVVSIDSSSGPHFGSVIYFSPIPFVVSPKFLLTSNATVIYALIQYPPSIPFTPIRR